MVKMKWFGHAAFDVEIANRVVLIDHWLDGNPMSSAKASEIAHADMVFVTHDHTYIFDVFNICESGPLLSCSVCRLSYRRKPEPYAMSGEVNAD